MEKHCETCSFATKSQIFNGYWCRRQNGNFIPVKADNWCKEWATKYFEEKKENELSTCPWCGAKFNEYKSLYIIEHKPSCYLSVAFHVKAVETIFKDEKSKIEAWNRRYQ